MYIIALRILKSNKYIHFYLKNNMFGKNGGHVEKNGRHLGLPSGQLGRFD